MSRLAQPSESQDPLIRPRSESPASETSPPLHSVPSETASNLPQPLPTQSTDVSPSSPVSQQKRHRHRKKHKAKLHAIPPTSLAEVQERPEDAWLFGTSNEDTSSRSESFEVAPGLAPAVEPTTKALPKTQLPLQTNETNNNVLLGGGLEVPGTVQVADHSPRGAPLTRRESMRIVPPGYKQHMPGSAPGYDLLESSEKAKPKLGAEAAKEGEERVSIEDTLGPHGAAKVVIVTYSADHVSAKTFFSATELSDFLEAEEEQEEEKNKREGEKTDKTPTPAPVRWIHLEGIDAEMIRVLAFRYSLHPLAIEDLMTFPPMTKVDSYSNLLFINCVLATLDDHRFGSGWFSDEPGAQKPEELHRFHRLRMLQQSAQDHGNFLPRADPSQPDEPSWSVPLMYNRSGRSWATTDDPRDKMRWSNVVIEPVGMFLHHKQSTLISVFAHEADEVVAPIMDRLSSGQTLLRRSQDPSFLMEAILDGVVDRIVQVVEEYSAEMESIERKVFQNPRQTHTKQLHLILLELHALRRVITPLDAVVEQLRQLPSQAGVPASSGEGTTHFETGGFVGVSRLTRFYLADVVDHIRFALEELTALETRIGDLSNLIFGLINHNQNTSMRLLALVSLVFLPLTFTAGIFGMNFDK